MQRKIIGEDLELALREWGQTLAAIPYHQDRAARIAVLLDVAAELQVFLVDIYVEVQNLLQEAHDGGHNEPH